MAKNYIIEQTKEGVLLVRDNVESRKVCYSAGLSTADPENPDRPRERQGFLEKFLNPMIQAGKIGNGVRAKWDDRKFRFDSASIAKNLELKLGITYFQECAGCRKRRQDGITKLSEEGKKRYNDPNAYFTRGCGIEVTPITSEGSIFVGKRKVQEEASGYSGELAAVNGWVDYKERLEDVDFQVDALREMEEEFGILKRNIKKMIFTGVYPAPNRADTDFVYLAWTDLPNSFFSSEEYKERRKDKEHEELVKITSFKDMKGLLETGELPNCKGRFNVLYSLRASLEQIKPGEMTI